MSAKVTTTRAGTGAHNNHERVDLRQELLGEPDTIAYIRVSGETARLGLDTHRTRLATFAQEEGWTPAFLEDYGSSASPRPGFDALMEAIRRGFVKRVLVAAAHQLARNLEQSVEIRRLLQSTGGELIDLTLPDGSTYRSASTVWPNSVFHVELGRHIERSVAGRLTP
jgi:predicted site-specific integrase-resolvase